MAVTHGDLESALFAGFEPVAHLADHPIHVVLGLVPPEDPGAKVEPSDQWSAVDPENDVPFAPEIDDLLRLHHLVLSRRVTTVLEFGVGYSTAVFAAALQVNEGLHTEVVGRDLRRSNAFEVHSADNDADWIAVARDRVPQELSSRVHLHHCPVEVGEFQGRLCTYYRDLPDLAPDLVYLDGPDLFSSSGDLRGLSTAHPDRMPMAADILVFEHFLTPGTLLVVDGRTANARFLAGNLQRNWVYWHAVEFDQHFFELTEAPLGPHNRRQVEYCLGPDFLRRVSEVVSVP
tara:strand:- start:1015 stop:1881 length:867 start_codon:yes stop_codon:yes gene_type:complete